MELFTQTKNICTAQVQLCCCFILRSFDYIFLMRIFGIDFRCNTARVETNKMFACPIYKRNSTSESGRKMTSFNMQAKPQILKLFSKEGSHERLTEEAMNN